MEEEEWMNQHHLLHHQHHLMNLLLMELPVLLKSCTLAAFQGEEHQLGSIEDDNKQNPLVVGAELSLLPLQSVFEEVRGD